MAEDSPTIVENENQPIEYSNDHIVVKLKKLPDCIASFQVTVKPEASLAAYAKALKAVAKEVSFPGFRKGKAPLDRIIKEYGTHTDKEWKRVLLTTAMSDAMELANLKPLSKDSILKSNVVKIFKDQDSEVTFEIEHQPQVPVIDLDAIHIKFVEPQGVSDQDLEKELTSIRLHSAKWTEIADRPVQEGDYVDLDIISLDTPGEALCKNTRFSVDAQLIPSWIHSVLIGLNKGDKAQGTTEQDPNHKVEHNENGEEIPFTPVHCEITVNSIHHAELPELNDEFAKKLGTDNLEVLKERVMKSLQLKAATAAWGAMESQIINALLTNYSFDIPKASYLPEQQLRINSVKTRLSQRHFSAEEQNKMFTETQRYISGLPTRYRLLFLTQKFADANKIYITKQELADEIQEQLLFSQAAPFSLIDETMDPSTAQYLMYNYLLLNKTIAFIVKNAKHVDKQSV